MLFAYSGAFIYSFDYTLVDRVAYDKLDRVRLARDSLVNPRRFLARLRG